MASSLVGRRLGKYDIVQGVGQGGMATVYKGYQSDIDRYVAVKVLPPHPGLDQEFTERFRLEARTIARLQHPHILPLYDYGVQDDILYLVMAYVDGGSLNDRIDQGKLALPDIARWLKQVAAALDYAHRQGVIHRDIKPDNILLDREGNALLADFGIVKLVEGEARLTITGGLVGTPAYMAPEQGRGEAITPSADLYSLGVVVFELITGKKPYTAPTPMQIVLKHMTDPVPSLRSEIANVPSALESVMQRALAKEPSDRYPTAAAFADAFDRAIVNHAATAHLDAGTQVVTSGSPPALPPVYPVSAAPGASSPGTNPNVTPPPTVIVQDRGASPLLLLAGFGMIAVVLVVAVFLLVNSQRDREAPAVPTTAPTREAAAVPTANRAGAPLVAAPARSFGRVSYTTTESLGDTLIIGSLQNLKPPPPGRVYAAWLKNTVTGDVMLLGEMAVDALGRGTIAPYIDTEGRPLFTLYNAIAITEEPRMAETPTGDVVYSARVPPSLMAALAEILVSSPDGFTRGDTAGSLLDGALTEATTGAQHAKMAADSTNLGGLRSHTEHVANILPGTTTDYNGDGRGENPGRGVGVLHFLDLIEQHLDTVADDPAATTDLQSELEFIRVCVQNTRERVDALVDLERTLVNATDMTGVSEQAAPSLALADALLHGVDHNSNGQVEPFEGECGLDQIWTFGTLVSSMNVVAGNLPD